MGAVGLLAVGLAGAYEGEILWDQWGVPSVYAADDASAFYGFGWAQTHSHGDLLLRLYGEGRGRGAEYWGEAHEETDRWLLANEAPALAELWLAAQEPRFRGCLEAFAAGINAYAAAHPERLAERVRVVLPVTAADVIAHANRLIYFEFVGSQAAAYGRRPTPEDRGGSNAWALAPARTAAGAAVLLQNPHLNWAESQQTYYEAHLNAPGLHLYGATQVGLPVIRFFFSERHGIANTVNGILARSLYKLTPAEGGYRFDGEVRPFDEHTVEYRVRRADGSLETKVLRKRFSVHGPVFERPDGTLVALRIAGLDRPGLLQQYWDMARAESFEAFRAVLRRLQIPTYNVVYADREGHIAYFHNGHLPKFGGGDHAFWSGLVPGDTSQWLWTDVHPLEDLPQVVDPPAGFVQNANDPPWWATWPQAIRPADYPAYAAAPGPMSLRAQSSVRLVRGDEKFSFDEITRRKMSTHVLLAERTLPELLDAARASADPLVRQAADLLAAWDRHNEADSRAALLFEAWAGRFGGRRVVAERNFAVRWSAEAPLETPRGLADPAAAVAQLRAAAEEVVARHGALDRPYGDVSRFALRGVSVPGHGGYGGQGVFRVFTWGNAEEGVSTPIHGETWTALIEFGQPLRARGLMSYGNASQPGTPHRADQLPLLARKELRPLNFTRAEVEAATVRREAFGRP